MGILEGLAGEPGSSSGRVTGRRMLTVEWSTVADRWPLTRNCEGGRKPLLSCYIRCVKPAKGQLLGQTESASAEQIAEALERGEFTFARTPTTKSGLFPPGTHPTETGYWLQGEPATSYGRHAARHELVHLGASLRGQEDRVVHELIVQFTTTPENPILGVGLIVGGVIGGRALTKKLGY